MATMKVLLAPKPKDPDLEDKYIKEVRNFFIAMGRNGATDQVKLAILQSVGEVDMSFELLI